MSYYRVWFVIGVGIIIGSIIVSNKEGILLGISFAVIALGKLYNPTLLRKFMYLLVILSGIYCIYLGVLGLMEGKFTATLIAFSCGILIITIVIVLWRIDKYLPADDNSKSNSESEDKNA